MRLLFSFLLGLLLTLPACTVPLSQGGALRHAPGQYQVPVVIHVPENYDHGLMAKWEVADKMLPVELREVRHDIRGGYDNGVVHVVFVPAALMPGILGLTEYVAPCSTIIYMRDDGADTMQTLAHELGHALGLEHVDEQDNLMYPIGIEGRSVLSTRQIRRARAVANAMRFCKEL